jgi:small subunit ribosomal protein S16
MPVKIRLARHGRKARPIYHIVVADSRAPRDGKYIEKLGLYNPNTNPATIDLEFDKALDWLQKGAQPTDTCRSLLSKKGVMMKKHLLEGAKKGAFSLEEAENRFDAWQKEKESKLQNAVDMLAKEKQTEAKAAFEREAKVNLDRAAELAKKKADAEKSAKAPEEEAAETAVDEQVQDSAEEAPAESKEE